MSLRGGDPYYKSNFLTLYDEKSFESISKIILENGMINDIIIKLGDIGFNNLGTRTLQNVLPTFSFLKYPRRDVNISHLFFKGVVVPT